MNTVDIALLLVLLSAVLHAGWNTLLKASKNPLATLALVDSSALLICLFALPFFPLPSLHTGLLIALSVLINTIYRLLLVKAYKIGDFGQVYPIVRGVPPVLVALVSALLLSEHLSLMAYLGIGLVSLGIISLSVVKTMNLALLTPILVAISTGFFVAGYTVVDALGVRSAESVLQFVVYYTICQSLTIPAIAWFKDKQALKEQARHQWKVGLLGGIAYLASYGLVLYAFSLVAVAKVAALRESSVVIGAIIATVFFKEPFGLRRIVSAVLICLGIVLIKTG